MKEDDYINGLFDEDGNPNDDDPEYGSINEWIDDMENLNYPDGMDED